MKRKKVAVLMGGPSSERGISFKSGRAVCEALEASDYRPVAIDAVDEWEDVIKAQRPDVAFIALHGKFGEDGTVQAILEELNIPYTGSGVEASRLAMNKIASKRVFEKAGIPSPEYIVVRKPSYDFDYKEIIFPVVVKPPFQGSSIGLTIVDDKSQIKKALDIAYVHDEEVIVEKFINGDELTVGILDNTALPVIKIAPARKFYDYKAKYISADTQYFVPAPIRADFYKRAEELALAAHNALGCRDFSRVDMILGVDGKISVLELNSIPGFTSVSLLPKSASAAGLSFKDLCVKIIELAVKNASSKKIQAAPQLQKAV